MAIKYLNKDSFHMYLSMTQKIAKDEPYIIANKYYNLAPSDIFQNELDLEYKIKDRISQYLSLPLSSIKIVGSSHIGSSPFKKTVFWGHSKEFENNLLEEYRISAKEGVNNKKERLIRASFLKNLLL